MSSILLINVYSCAFNVAMETLIITMASNRILRVRGKVGGYDYEFVDKVPEDFTCPIFTLVQKEAHQVICYGKVYCKSCLEKLKKKRDKFLCPNCRTSLDRDHKFFPDN